MFNINTLNKISAAGTDNFDKTKYTVGDSIENPDAIMVRSAKMHDMVFGDKLLAIARAGAGTNNIPVDECAEKGICVFNTPGANANAVKELVIAGLLMSSRKVTEAIKWADTLKGNGDEVGKMVEKGKSQFVGPEISGKTLGVIGLGAIGVLVCNAAISMGMKVIGYDPFMSVKAAWGLSPSVKHAASLSEIYANSDYITIHVPYNADTKGCINSETIAQMKNGVRILNFARGELVNSADIVEAVKSGKVAKYVVDFPSDDVIGVENIIAIPHLGASTPESEDNCADMASRELIDYLENGNISNSVNLPAAQMARTGETRICIIHKNIPAVLTKATAAVEGLNIENMINQSRKDMAYTILDVDGRADNKVVDTIKAIEGVIRVRII